MLTEVKVVILSITNDHHEANNVDDCYRYMLVMYQVVFRAQGDLTHSRLVIAHILLLIPIHRAARLCFRGRAFR